MRSSSSSVEPARAASLSNSVRAGYVKARAARLLGMSVRQLTYRVQKYGIAVERF